MVVDCGGMEVGLRGGAGGGDGKEEEGRWEVGQ